jgi:hypothetical protein
MPDDARGSQARQASSVIPSPPAQNQQFVEDED